VYVLNERFPMVAGGRRFFTGQNDAARGMPRLVCWGIAMPGGENAWHLYIFQATDAGQARPIEFAAVPLPPNASRNLSLRDVRGGIVLGFSGRGSPTEWMKFYDDWFSGKGWSSDDGWLNGDGASSARFHKPGAPEAGRAEIQFAEGSHGELMGML